ncbi:MAG TPA: hypothetical protein VGN20_15720 [Mucilaginibacter sp.]|jgi:hypothetical protein
MDIELKYKIAEMIIQLNDDALPNEIKSLAGLPDSDFWNDVPDECKKTINQAKEELDKGEGIPHSQVMVDVKARFLNK